MVINLQKVILEKVFTHTIQLDMSSYSKGNYLLNVKTEKGLLTKKIIIE